ncbi:metal ABC transporter permease [Alphaproteobacteria bacterium]|nr:metal ABC transporter permease [Alphaproteobacteria bacterium]
MTDQMLSAIIAGLAIALTAAPLGCFVVWRRMAYFGDGLSHSALLGIALGLLFGISSQVGILLVALGFAGALIFLQSRDLLATDTLLGLLAHSTLALGILAMSLMGFEHIDIHKFLVGSINALNAFNAYLMLAGSVICIATLRWLWPGLLLMVTSEDLAQAEGVPVRLYETGLMVLMALLVAISIQLVGILLITSLLIIPASAARLFSRTPEQMAVGASIFASATVLLGIIITTSPDGHDHHSPGPIIVSIMVGVFVAMLMVRLIAQRISRA